MRLFRGSCGGCMTVISLTLIGGLFAGTRGMIAGFLFALFWNMLFSSPDSGRQTSRERLREMLEQIWSQSRATRAPTEAVHALTGLFMAVVRQNERGLREIHVAMARQILGVYARQGGISPRQMIHSFQQWETKKIPVEKLAGTVREEHSPRARKNFLHDMMMVAFADGRMQKDEAGILRYLTDEFGFDKAVYEDIFEKVKERLRYSGEGQRRGRTRGQRDRRSRRPRDRHEPSLDQAYDILGCSRDDPDSRIKKQYRQLAREHHPDQRSDDTDSAREEAEDEMVRINRAYRKIMETRE